MDESNQRDPSGVSEWRDPSGRIRAEGSERRKPSRGIRAYGSKQRNRVKGSERRDMSGRIPSGRI